MTAHIFRRWVSVSLKVVTDMSELGPLLAPVQLPALTLSLIGGIHSF